MAWLSTVAAVMLIHWVACVVPGPNTLIVSTVAMKETRANGMAVAVGIATGALVWSIVSMTGLALALQHAPVLFRALQGIGGLYLLYVAYGMIRAALVEAAPARTDIVRGPPALDWPRAYRRGLVTSLTNPKAAIYFLGIFAVAVAADTPNVVRVVIVIACLCITLGWYTILALLLSTAPAQRSYLRLRRPIDGVAGALFGVFGVLLLVAAFKAV